MRFLLDTDTCVYALNKHASVLAQLGSKRRTDIGISVLTEAELGFGVANSRQVTKNRRALDTFLMPFVIVDFTSFEVPAYAEIRHRLERAGTPISGLDMLIAAQARAHDLTLVTNNEREFRRVAGLRVENWTH